MFWISFPALGITGQICAWSKDGLESCSSR